MKKIRITTVIEFQPDPSTYEEGDDPLDIEKRSIKSGELNIWDYASKDVDIKVEWMED